MHTNRAGDRPRSVDNPDGLVERLPELQTDSRSKPRSGSGAEPHPLVDASVFVAALPEHDDYLRGLVWATVRDREAIDDIMQATYERAYQALPKFEGRSSLRTWLHTICFRTSIDHIRHESGRRTSSLEIVGPESQLVDATRPPVAGSPAGDPADGVAARNEALGLLERLDPEQRALLYFTAGLGYSFDEVAEIVGQPRGTVASKVSRAKERLRRGPRP